MRKNRKQSKRMSVIATNTVRVGAVVLVSFVMAILYVLSGSGCDQLVKAKGEKERELERLGESCQRESTRWEEMCTPEKIEVALLKRGMAMHLPRPDQSIRLKADGMPYPGQVSVRRAKQRCQSEPATYRRRKR